MKRRMFTVLLVFTAYALFAQTLKDLVCLVGVGYVDSTASGTGFLISDGEGNQYVVSNNHVTQKGTITVIFNEEDGTKRRFEQMVVLACDALYDISVLGFPMGRKIRKPGLKVDITRVEKGVSVAAAGYPGMSWKVTNGKILDNNVPAYRSGTIQPFYAHDAQLDHGNSGGPLLRQQPDLPAGWAVIGINTLKSDSGPGYSIPSGRLVSLLNAAAAVKTENKIQERDNGSKEKAVKLESPVISTAMKSQDYIGWYSFSPDTEGDLEVTVQSAENFRLEIYDSSDNLLGTNTGKNPSLSVHIPSGDLFLKVTGDNLIYWTTYTVSAYVKTFSD